MKPANLGSLLRYGAVSAAALGADMAMMWLLIHTAQWHVLAASAAGFVLGMVLAYLLSCYWAFQQHAHVPSWQGWFAFSTIGLAGLVLNSAVVWLCTVPMGLAWPFAKLAAAAGSFSFNYTLRRWMLFRPALRNPGFPR